MITIQLFDDPALAPVAQFSSTLPAVASFGFGLGGYPPNSFLDSAGQVVISGFDFEVDLLGINVGVGANGVTFRSPNGLQFRVISEVPEPGTVAIFGLVLAGLGLMRPRKRTAA